MTQLTLGLLGLGEATQILHIPALRQLPDLFRIAGVHDPAHGVAEALGFAPQSLESLLADTSIDAVLVAGPNATHAPQAVAALQAGKHVMIEKPMCMTTEEGVALAAAQGSRVVQVGYMRRHAPAFEEAVALVAERRNEITFARVRDIIGMNHLFIEPTSHVHRGAVPEALRSSDEAGVMALAGTAEGPRALVARLLLGLSTHDISAMREMLGMPRQVLSAHFRQGGRFFTVLFDYGSFTCQFETGIDDLARFDAEVEVMLPDMTVSVIYDTPYVRNQPARLRVTRQNTPQGVTVSEGYPSRQDAFVPEWWRFHAAITQDASVKTDIADAMQDLAIFHDIMAKLEG
jgi:predicted dehydrogenase